MLHVSTLASCSLVYVTQAEVMVNVVERDGE
jgi:hypothetical protein